MELTELELKHQEAPDLQGEQTTPGQPWAPCLTQLLEASFTDLHGKNTLLDITVRVLLTVDGVLLCVKQFAFAKLFCLTRVIRGLGGRLFPLYQSEEEP